MEAGRLAMSLSSSVLSSLRLTAGVPVVRVKPGNEAFTGTQVWVLDCSGVQRRLDAKRISGGWRKAIDHGPFARAARASQQLSAE